MPQAYSNLNRENDPHALPDVEYWHHAHNADGSCADGNGVMESDGDENVCLGAGWYWWPCSPGCVPDGDPSGPFETEIECIADFTEEPTLEDLEPEFSEPEEGDYTICDARNGVAVTIVGDKHLGTFKTREDAEQAIREDMERAQFWPNVWFVSDHGNAHLVTL